jgi:hypothetical protein
MAGDPFCEDCGVRMSLHYCENDCDNANRRADLLCTYGTWMVTP